MKHLLTSLFLLSAIGTFGQNDEREQKEDRFADSLIRQGQHETLSAYFKKELVTRPRDENVLRWLGFLAIADQQYEVAEHYYTEALAVNPTCARCYMNIGRTYSMRRDGKKATEYFDKAIVMDAADALLYSARAKQKEYSGDMKGALADYNKAIELDPKTPDYYLERGLYHSNQGLFTIAINDLNKAVELAPDHYYPYFQRASSHYANKKVYEALKDIHKAIQLDSTRAELYTGRGAVYAFLEEYEKANADYTKAIELNPNDYFPYYNRASGRYKLEDMDGSCSDLHACYDLLLKVDPENELKKELEYSLGNYCDSSQVSYYYQRGIAYFNLGQFDKAIRIYSVGVSKFPDNSMTLSFRGNAYFAAMQYEKALADYYASIENKANVIRDVEANQQHTGMTSESMDTYVNGFLAIMQVSIAESKFALGDYEAALAEINKGIEIAPSIKEYGKENYYNVRGNIYLALGKYQLALADFDKCISFNPSFAIAYANRAVAKINLANKVSMTSSAVSVGTNNQSFQANWVFPSKSGSKRSEATLVSAMADCNNAVELDENLSLAYYIRGHIKKMLERQGYCYDFLRAKNLGYLLEPELVNECEK